MEVKHYKIWENYPIGTKAFSICGGYWIKIKTGWQWHTCNITIPEPRAWLFSGFVEEPVIKKKKPSKMKN